MRQQEFCFPIVGGFPTRGFHLDTLGAVGGMPARPLGVGGRTLRTLAFRLRVAGEQGEPKGVLAMEFKKLCIQILGVFGANPVRRAGVFQRGCGTLNWLVRGKNALARHRVKILVGFLAASSLIRPAMAADPPVGQDLTRQSGKSFWGTMVAPSTKKQNRKAFWALVSVATASNVLDLEYTQHMLHQSPNVYETDPVYGRRPSRLEAYPISFGIQAGYTLAAYELRRRRIKFLWTAPLLYVTAQHLEGFATGVKVQRQLEATRLH